MKTILPSIVLVAYCIFWFAIALAAGTRDGSPWWMPFAILVLVALPGAVGIALGHALAEHDDET
ncbi:hypothetical protein ACKI2N_012470 [Cupriavidus sp. 30B13]|uniref:hypothetical protein n=1 Tax=Cupriavidus sp. 30B13 TaxID=3384241 RepID=UPI003B9035CB